MDVIYERDLTRFAFKMGFVGVSYIYIAAVWQVAEMSSVYGFFHATKHVYIQTLRCKQLIFNVYIARAKVVYGILVTTLGWVYKYPIILSGRYKSFEDSVPVYEIDGHPISKSATVSQQVGQGTSTIDTPHKSHKAQD